MSFDNKAYQKDYKEKNKEKLREYKKAWREKQRQLHGSYKSTSDEYMKNWRESNADHVKDYAISYYEENKEVIAEKKKSWRKDASDLIAIYNKEYRQKNRGLCNAHSAKRRARKKNATPKWITKEMYLEMKGFYDEAVQLTENSGVEHAVDHIYPLVGKDSCGLHVPWNLQVLTRSENSSKRNSNPENFQYHKLPSQHSD